MPFCKPDLIWSDDLSELEVDVSRSADYSVPDKLRVLIKIKSIFINSVLVAVKDKWSRRHAALNVLDSP